MSTLTLDPFQVSNHFLAALGDEEFANLRPHLHVITKKVGEVLYVRDDPVKSIYFPLTAVVSLITTVQEGRAVEVALVGREGIAGIWAALGSQDNFHEAVVQIPGDLGKIRVDLFRAELMRSPSMLHHLHRYTRFLIAQISQSAACNRLHRLEQRLARWLLMTHDNVKNDTFHETHEFLSHMLGSDRSEVTLAAGILRKSGLIQYARGKVNLLDRKGLEKVSCDCYRIYAAEITRLNQKEL